MSFYFARFTRIINGLPTFPRTIPTSQASQIQRICGVQLNGKVLIERFILFSGLCYVCIDQAAVVSGSLHSCTMITALDLNVVHMILLIDRQNIKSDRASLKVFDPILAGGFCDLQIITFQNNLEQKFSALRVLKDLRHEVIIEQAQIVKTLQIFFIVKA